MTFIETDQLERSTGKQLYDYQQEAIEKIFDSLAKNPADHNLLYQLPTGGGKTVIFTEIAKRYIQSTKKKVVVLTHRIELCNQTSKMLEEFNVSCKIIDSSVKSLPDQGQYDCFVAMVETLNNRLRDEVIEIDNIGLVIVDEAHYNSFRKMFKHFKECTVLGVTATPLSSNINLPMYQNYKELIVGDSIASLIKKGFLAKATTFCYDVGLGSLKIGANGDYTVKSSELLYGDFPMLEKLLRAYYERCEGKKTLIFNNGINTSLNVYDTFKKAKLNVRHLDNTNTSEERRDILQWFKETPDAILTSVGILTTGFDEPTVESIILNRATRSLTLYHQMIGRGSRVLPHKKDFVVVDLGNNAARFGAWDTEIDWHEIFRNPDFFLSNISSDDEIERKFKYKMPEEIRNLFKNSENIDFDVDAAYQETLKKQLKPQTVLQKSLDQHLQMCIENSEDIMDARILAKHLKDDIAYRVRLYSYNICKSTENYLKWLEDDYFRKLNTQINHHYTQVEV